MPPAPGRDPEVAFPLAIAAVVLGVVGLTVPLLTWVALGLSVIAYLLNMPHAPTRTLAIVGAVLGLVGVSQSLIG